MRTNSVFDKIVADGGPIRLAGPDAIVVAVPEILGFHPEESVVIACMTGVEGRLGPVARVDLPQVVQAELGEQLISCARRYADAVAIICYHSAARPDSLDALIDSFIRAGIDIAAVLSVSDGRIRDSTSLATHLADPGYPVPGPEDARSQRLAAANALRGRQVLPSRAMLSKSVSGPRGEQLAQAEDAIEHARIAMSEVAHFDDPSDNQAQRETMTTLLADAVREHQRSGAVSLATASELIAVAESVPCRDLLIGLAVEYWRESIVPTLISVISQCPDRYVAEIGSVLALSAYRYGDGALAQCVIDRVISARPEHRLAHLLLAAISSGLPPEELSTMARVAGIPEQPTG